MSFIVRILESFWKRGQKTAVVQGVNSVESEYFRAKVPTNWRLNKNSEGSVIECQSADETKGLYISIFQNQKFVTNEAWILEQMQFEIDRLLAMEGQSFRLLNQQIYQSGKLWIGEWDGLSDPTQYRIVTKNMLKGAKLIRMSFHDYQFESLEKSNAIRDLIFESFEVKTAFYS
jgi:hypothetical protein